MGYWANPFDTKAGYKLMDSFFQDLYVGPSGRIMSDDSEVSRSNFENNFFGPTRAGPGPGATKLRVMINAYDEFRSNMAADCGIYRCTGCNRVDYLFNWEFLDLSVYNESSWDQPTADLVMQPGGIYSGGAYDIIAHVRCNEVSTCNACGLTFHAPVSDIDSCPECGAGPADPSNDNLGMVQAGCGATGAVRHAVTQLTEAQTVNLELNWKSQTGRSNFVELQRSRNLTVRIPKVVGARSYRLTWAGDDRSAWRSLQGKTFKTRGEAMRWVPKLVMQIGNESPEFPISLFGGYSQKSSPIYPGLFAFGGASANLVKINGVPTPYLGGYRTPEATYGDKSARRSCYEVAGMMETVRFGATRVPIGNPNGTSRANRDYHNNILVINPVSGFNGGRVSVAPRGRVGNLDLNYSGAERFVGAVADSNNTKLYVNGRFVGSYGGGSANAKDIADSLPVLRYRTFQNSAGQTVNLINPMMRDIEDSGMVRVTPIPIIPDRTAPGVLTQEKPAEEGGPPASCPNDISASIQIARHEIDAQDSMIERVVRFIEGSLGTRSAAFGIGPDYPFGITDLLDDGINDETKQRMLDLGLQIPKEAPGTGYSYLVTANRARAGIKSGNSWLPALRTRSRINLVAAPPANQLNNLWLDSQDPDDYDPTLFYVRIRGKGTRRDPSTYQPPVLVPRFGSVMPGFEILEDPFHESKIVGQQLNLVQIHKVFSLPPPYPQITSMQKYTTLLCETCLTTATTGSILIQRERQGCLANLVIDPANGIPQTWDYIPRNRAGIPGWMIAAEIAFEGNRQMQTCPDLVRRNPGVSPPEFDRYYLVPSAGGIEDFRWPGPMAFVRESELTSVPGYSSHDDDKVVVGGQVYPRPTPRMDYLLGPHDSRGRGNNPLAAAGQPRLRSEADRALYRQHQLPDGSSIWAPVMWGVLDEGRLITTGASNIANIHGGTP